MPSFSIARILSKFIFLSSFILFFFFTASRAEAAEVFTIPDKPVKDVATYLVATGCSPNQQVEFVWTKRNPDGNTIRKTATSNSYGVASFQHRDGYSLDRSDTYYDLSATCGSNTFRTTFIPISQPSPGWSIHEGSVSKIPSCGIGFSMYDYPSEETCNAMLNKLKGIVGNIWYKPSAAPSCSKISLSPPGNKQEDTTYYATEEECIGETGAPTPTINDPDKKWRIIYPAGVPQCTEDSNGGQYATQAECQNAIKNNFVWVADLTENPPLCKQVNKSSSPSKSFSTKAACDTYLQEEQLNHWDYNIPDSIDEGVDIEKCSGAPDGPYDSEAECKENFCGELKEKFEEIPDEYAGECAAEPTPTVPAGRPPCVEAIGADGRTITNGGDVITEDFAKCTKVATAIGDISTEPLEFIESIFGVILSISGGLAILIIMYAGYRLTVSQGNPDGIKGARELLVSAIVGLLFIIFSIVILEVIGVDVLRIPFFSAERGSNSTIRVNNPDPNAACVQTPGNRGESCPDGSGNYACGYCTEDTGCPLCSPVIDCRTGVYSIASCSGGGFRCTSDDQCKNHRSSCPQGQVGIMACQNGGCVTVSCRIIKNTKTGS